MSKKILGIVLFINLYDSKVYFAERVDLGDKLMGICCEKKYVFCLVFVRNFYSVVFFAVFVSYVCYFLDFWVGNWV